MPNILMPDGVTVSFPDDMPKDQIKGMIAKKFPQLSKSPAEQEMAGQAAALHSVAGAVGTVASPLNKAMGAVGGAIGKGMAYLNPKGAEEAKQIVGAVAKPVGEAIGKFQQSNPKTAAVLGDVASIAGNVPALGAEKMLAKAAIDATGIKAGSELAKIGFKTTEDSLKNNLQGIYQEGTDAFEKSKRMGAVLKPQAASKMLATVRKQVPNATEAEKIAYGDITKNIDAMEKDIAAGNTGLSNFHLHRQNIADIAQKFTNKDAQRVATKAIRGMDLSLKRMRNADLASNSRASIDAWREGMHHWSRAKAYEKIVNIVSSANGDYNKIISGVNRLFNPKTQAKNLSGLRTEEKAMLRKIRKGTKIEHVLQGLGNLVSYKGIRPLGGAANVLAKGRMGQVAEQIAGREMPKPRPGGMPPVPVRPPGPKQLTYQPGGTQVHAQPVNPMNPQQLAAAQAMARRTGMANTPDSPSTIYSGYGTKSSMPPERPPVDPTGAEGDDIRSGIEKIMAMGNKPESGKAYPTIAAIIKKGGIDPNSKDAAEIRHILGMTTQQVNQKYRGLFVNKRSLSTAGGNKKVGPVGLDDFENREMPHLSRGGGKETDSLHPNDILDAIKREVKDKGKGAMSPDDPMLQDIIAEIEQSGHKVTKGYLKDNLEQIVKDVLESRKPQAQEEIPW